jgi:hypothetical protein
MLLPVTVLMRRADTAAVVVSALAAGHEPGGVPPDRRGFGSSGGDGAGLVASLR